MQSCNLAICTLYVAPSHRASFSRLPPPDTAICLAPVQFIHFTRAEQPPQSLLSLQASKEKKFRRISFSTRQITFLGCSASASTEVSAISASPHPSRSGTQNFRTRARRGPRPPHRRQLASDRTLRCHIAPITSDERHQLGSKALQLVLLACIFPLPSPSAATDTQLFQSTF